MGPLSQEPLQLQQFEVGLLVRVTEVEDDLQPLHQLLQTWLCTGLRCLLQCASGRSSETHQQQFLFEDGCCPQQLQHEKQQFCISSAPSGFLSCCNYCQSPLVLHTGKCPTMLIHLEGKLREM